MKHITGSDKRASGLSVPAAGRTAQFHAIVLSAALAGASIGVSGARAESGASPAQTASACATYGGWIDVRTGRALDRGDLFRDLVAKASVVLLGESHTDVDHHLWELHTVAALHGRGGTMVIGFEAFPRRLQPVLDDWIAGKLTEEAFLKASEWRQVWGYDAALYMPLFQFARLNRIPMIALNVERSLVAHVGKEGWQGVPAPEREGLSDPAPASQPYQRELARVFAMKKTMSPEALSRLASAQGNAQGSAQGSAQGNAQGNAQAPNPPEPEETALAEAMKQPEFTRFVEAQLTWDRAMAEALAGAKRKFPDATVIGILGSGHVEGGNGVPHQLKALGITAQATLIPVSTEEACTLVGTSYADAVFTLQHAEESPPPDRPRLGVVLGPGDGAPLISRVVSDSVAETTGLKVGDQVVRAAGLDTRVPEDVVDIIGRQAPGTWLPLSIKRDGQQIDLVAKFPARPNQDR